MRIELLTAEKSSPGVLHIFFEKNVNPGRIRARPLRGRPHADPTTWIHLFLGVLSPCVLRFAGNYV